MFKKKTAQSRIVVTRPLVLGSIDADHWKFERAEVFKELRKHAMPIPVLDAVEGLTGHFGVRWATRSGGQPKAGAPANVLVEPRQRKIRPTSSEKANHEAALKVYLQAYEAEGFPETADEVLACCLLTALRSLGDGRGAPVRHGGKLPRSVISAAAMMILEGNGRAPGPFLLGLLHALLVVSGGPKEFRARKMAIEIFAQAPSISMRDVARMVGVHSGTVSRWTKETSFVEEVESQRDWQSGRSLRSSRKTSVAGGAPNKA